MLLQIFPARSTTLVPKRWLRLLRVVPHELLAFFDSSRSEYLRKLPLPFSAGNPAVRPAAVVEAS